MSNLSRFAEWAGVFVKQVKYFKKCINLMRLACHADQIINLAVIKLSERTAKRINIKVTTIFCEEYKQRGKLERERERERETHTHTHTQR